MVTTLSHFLPLGARAIMRAMKLHYLAPLLVCSALACDDDDGRALRNDAAVNADGSAMDAAKIDAAAADAATAGDAGQPDGTASDAVSADAAPALMPGALPVRGYLTPTDSPFSGVDFAYFHLENFEDSLLNTPGVSDQGQGRKSSSFGPSLIDSVDVDDGDPTDDKCAKATGSCDAWWGSGTLKFTFDAAALGGLPTHAGAVWTDGSGQVGFEAFGADGQVVYSVAPFSEPGFPDDTVNSSTREDRFFGAYVPGGITAIRIYNTAGGIEVDHLQYGRAR